MAGCRCIVCWLRVYRFYQNQGFIYRRIGYLHPDATNWMQVVPSDTDMKCLAQGCRNAMLIKDA